MADQRVAAGGARGQRGEVGHEPRAERLLCRFDRAGQDRVVRRLVGVAVQRSPLPRIQSASGSAFSRSIVSFGQPPKSA